MRAVHDTRGNQAFKRIADTRILDLEKKMFSMTWCGIHIWIRLSIFAACKQDLCIYSRILRLRPKTGPTIDVQA